VARFVKLMESKNWIFDFPKGGLESHLFEDARTQTQAASGVSRAGGTEWKVPKSDSDISDKKRKGVMVLGDLDQENIGVGNGTVKRQPNKKISGNKPFKLPRMSVLTDVVNEALY
jgi:hypothetical protein